MSQVSQVSSLNNDINFDYNFGNYNPNDVSVEETINAVFVIDTSSSIHPHVQDLNANLNDFIERMQKSHIADKLFVSQVEFNSQVHVEHGFKPISELGHVDLSPRVGGTTALYKAVETALQNAINYRKDLENVGVNCKTLLFVMTDGENNEPGEASAVKSIIDNFLVDEKNILSFQSILFGMGNSAKFDAA